MSLRVRRVGVVDITGAEMAKRVKDSGASPRREGPSVNTLGPTKATPSRCKKEAPVEREYVGIDLHRRRSVIVRKNAAGEVLSN